VRVVLTGRPWTRVGVRTRSRAGAGVVGDVVSRHNPPVDRRHSSGRSRGHTRERDARRQLEADGWIVIRAAGSLGVADLVCFRADRVPRLVEVKSTAQSAYERFSPLERARMSDAASQAGVEAWLVWWPPRRSLAWIPEHEWPAVKP
jgi:Holliday junction resolvase